MRIAIVHNLRTGGAHRRLTGTAHALFADPTVELHEFHLGAGPSVLPRAATAHSTCTPYRPLAGATSRITRPPLRYADHMRLGHAWRRLAIAIEAWRPDVIFANPCGISLASPAVLQRLVEPIVYYCDEPRRQDYESAARNATNRSTRSLYAVLRALEKRSDRRSIRRSNRLLTNSTYTALAIEAAYGRTADVVAPGVSQVFSTGEGSQTREATHVLSVGTLIPSKGHDLAIRAVARSGLRLPLTIVAPRPSTSEEVRLQSIAQSEGVELRLRLGISDEELAWLYGTAFATLYLARAEPLGLVSYESQACATPVVVANEGGLAGTVIDNVNGFRVERSADEAASALRRLADPLTRAAMSQAAASHPVPRHAEGAQRLLAILAEAEAKGPADRRKTSTS